MTSPPPLNVCAKCGDSNYEEGYKTKLCTPCRNELAKFPIPQWLQISAGAVLVFVLIGLFFISKPLIAAIHFAKAKKFMEAHKYTSASSELSKVTSVYPNNIEANTRAMIAYGYCLNGDSVGYYYEKVVEKQMPDDNLLNEATSFIQGYFNLMYNDTLVEKALKEKQKKSIYEFDKYVKEYTDSFPDNIPAKIHIAGLYVDMNMNEKADTLLSDVITRAPNTFTSYIMIVPVKRELGQIEEAEKYADKLLEFNKENSLAYSHKARIALKKKDLTHAKEYADMAYALQPNSIWTHGTLALVNFYIGKEALSKKYIASLKSLEIENSDTGISSTSLWVDSIITGKKSL